MLTRWHWPPDISMGLRPPASSGSMPTASRVARAFSLRSRLVPIPHTDMGSITASRTRRRGLSDEIGSWNTIWILVRALRSSPRANAVSSVPSNLTEPESG